MTKKYCEISQVKTNAVGIIFEDLGFDDESKYDQHIDSRIERASRFIDRHCNRPDDFFNGGTAITEYQDGKQINSPYLYFNTERSQRTNQYARTLFLRHAPIISVTHIYKNIVDIGATANWVEIASSQYSLNSQTGRVVFSATQTPPAGTDNIKIIYVAGYSTTPTDIKFACEELVVNLLKLTIEQNARAKIRFAQPTRVEFANPKILNDSIVEKLQPYVNRRF